MHSQFEWKLNRFVQTNAANTHDAHGIAFRSVATIRRDRELKIENPFPSRSEKRVRTSTHIAEYYLIPNERTHVLILTQV